MGVLILAAVPGSNSERMQVQWSQLQEKASGYYFNLDVSTLI